ncbi:succinate--hydroxymethylglutarate CoA-transferase [Planococcus citri]|uniref:succinate--hydroxymethylglutarate CoA-transferase n=1 Tax=Planococcus citri TaxID=170843 RepID=UPI0031F7F0AC
MIRNILSSSKSCVLVISKCYSTKSADGPLKGIKVLDLSRIIAGPMCTLMLADLGADVYKVENPGRGDDSRRWPPIFKDGQSSSTFIALNRNKKSICVDFKTKDGQELLKKMAEKCDVLVENYVPGVLKKYSLDYDSLKEVAPHLVYCSLTGFGSKGPYANKPGVDLIAASLSGNLYITGPEDGEPCRSGTSTIDIMTGLRANAAIIAALYDKAKTGRGRKIDADLFSTAVVSLKNYAVSYLNMNIDCKRLGTEHSYVVPYKCFKSKDSYITVGAINDPQFKILAEIVGRPELAQDEKFATATARSKNRKVLTSLFCDIFVTKTTKEWCALLAGTPLPHAPLNGIKEVFEDPHLKAIELVKEIDHPTLGKIKVLDSPVKFSDYESIPKPSPLLGQDTDEILKNVLGFDDEKIQQLKTDKIVE